MITEEFNALMIKVCTFAYKHMVRKLRESGRKESALTWVRQYNIDPRIKADDLRPGFYAYYDDDLSVGLRELIITQINTHVSNIEDKDKDKVYENKRC